MGVSGGKICSFFGKSGVLCFLETPVLRFALVLLLTKCSFENTLAEKTESSTRKKKKKDLVKELYSLKC